MVFSIKSEKRKIRNHYQKRRKEREHPSMSKLRGVSYSKNEGIVLPSNTAKRKKHLNE